MTPTTASPLAGLLADPALIRLARAMHASGWRRLNSRRRTHRSVRAWHRSPREVVAVRIRPANDGVDIHICSTTSMVSLTGATDGGYALVVVATALGLPEALTGDKAAAQQRETHPSSAQRLRLRPRPVPVDVDAAVLGPPPLRTAVRVVDPPTSAPGFIGYSTKGARP